MGLEWCLDILIAVLPGLAESSSVTLISIPGSGRNPSNIPFLSLNSFLDVKVLIENRSQLSTDRRLSEMPLSPYN